MSKAKFTPAPEMYQALERLVKHCEANNIRENLEQCSEHLPALYHIAIARGEK